MKLFWRGVRPTTLTEELKNMAVGSVPLTSRNLYIQYWERKKLTNQKFKTHVHFRFDPNTTYVICSDKKIPWQQSCHPKKIKYYVCQAISETHIKNIL